MADNNKKDNYNFNRDSTAQSAVNLDDLFGNSSDTPKINITEADDGVADKRAGTGSDGNADDRFAHVHAQETAETQEKTEANIDVYGVGLYSTGYKVFVSLLMIIFAAAIGGMGVLVSYLFDLYYFYAIIYMPVIHVGVMLIYYVAFAVRGYNYRKRGRVTVPVSEDRTYRRLHSMYYTTKRAVLLIVMLVLLNVSFLISSNVLYEVLFL